MKVIRTICRVILALALIFTGFLNIINPACIGFWGTLLGAVAFLSGFCLIAGLQRRIFSTAAAVMVLVAFIFCAIRVITEPGGASYLLGDAVRLNTSQAFGFVLAMIPFCAATFISSVKDKCRKLPLIPELIFIALFAIFTVTIPLDAIKNLPRFDCTEFKAGTDIRGNDNIPCEEESLVAAVFWNPSKVDSVKWADVALLSSDCELCGKSFAVYSAGPSIPAWLEEFLSNAGCDDLRKLMPSNGGAVLFNEGRIAAKMPANKIISDDFTYLMDQDPDILMAQANWKATKFIWMVIAIAALLLIACGITKRKISSIE